MLDISAVLRTGDRLTPDTPGCIFIGITPHATSLSAPGPGVSLFGSDREQRRSCLLSVLRSRRLRVSALSASVRAFSKVQSAGQTEKKRSNKIQN